MNGEEGDGRDGVRLQLAMARAGVASRRHAEEMIADGRVRVNGETVTAKGVRVDPATDRIEVDGKPLPHEPQRRTTIALNKPVGWLSAASDGHGGKVVTWLVRDIPARLVPAGRLDKDSSGLMIMSDDGELVARLMHPRGGHSKKYMVEVSGRCNAATLAMLRGEMVIDGYKLRPVQVDVVKKLGHHSMLRFTLHEGRNRQIRKMCAAAGLNVVRLVRTDIGPISLGGLSPGQYRMLSDSEIAALAAPPPGAELVKSIQDAGRKPMA